MWPALIAAAAPSIGKIFGGLLHRRPRAPRFQDTESGRMLRRRMSQGLYSPTAQQNILGQVSKQAGAVAGEERAAIRGGLAAGGMSRSIAGIRLLNSPDVQRTKIMAGATENLQTQNEMSKETAAGQYAQGADATEAQRREESAARHNEIVDSIIGGVTGAAQAGIGAFQDEKMYGEYTGFEKGMDQYYALLAAKRYDEAAKFLEEMMGGIPGRMPQPGLNPGGE